MISVYNAVETQITVGMLSSLLILKSWFHAFWFGFYVKVVGKFQDQMYFFF